MKYRAFLLMTLVALPLHTQAAISEGKLIKDPVAAERRRQEEYYRAEQSNQERLKVGRQRYEQKQENRARIIAAMNSEMRARSQTVVVPNTPAIVETVALDASKGISPAVLLFGAAFLGGCVYIYRAFRSTRNSLPAPRKPAYL